MVLFFIQGIDMPEDLSIPIAILSCLLTVEYSTFFVEPAVWLGFGQSELPSDIIRFLFRNKATFALIIGRCKI